MTHEDAPPGAGMSIAVYSREDERAIRAQRHVEDWARSGLLDRAQRDRLIAALPVDLRRTNRFLRATLFIFGLVIVASLAGLIVVTLDLDNAAVLKALALLGSAACLAAAEFIIRRYRLYHFGIEEAVIAAGLLLFVVFVATVGRDDFSTLAAFAAAALGSLAIFLRFGYLYAGVAATVLAPMVVFDLDQTDTVRRLAVFALLLAIFLLARVRRLAHDDEYPGDAYGVIAAVAWGAMYFVANLKISDWWSVSDSVGAFEWATYAVVWIVPPLGLWVAIRDRLRALLDVNIAAALVTVMTNKLYLGLEQQPWDPMVFGLLLIAVAIAVRRWLAAGPGESRAGFTPKRLLASEQDRVALVGSATVLAPGAPPGRTHPPGGPSLGGGASGGAGASGQF